METSNIQPKPGCLMTASGFLIDPLSVKDFPPLDDLVMSISNICRFGGHCNNFYSVAEHSVHCALLADHFNEAKEVVQLMLLHDLTEGILCDIPRPYKDRVYLKVNNEIVSYREYEEKLFLNLLSYYGYSYSESDLSKIKIYDNMMLETELMRLRGNTHNHKGEKLIDNYPHSVNQLLPKQAFTFYKNAFNTYFK